eukprot:gnl/TRDRNA2_/TRDRNA2_182184_c0_seq1.p1 gnl/TRDRNA2_/TRDRNA2_182184_c0~~gnl/TRDRNA2_/TRDRNA2_182184_c0_seq1.p1  ORF type:complete len:279 (-),score=59.04 gnl/TRDRNA2_/TRDRNA2_182184_c0_seq1:61-897(-)
MAELCALTLKLLMAGLLVLHVSGTCNECSSESGTNDELSLLVVRERPHSKRKKHAEVIPPAESSTVTVQLNQSSTDSQVVAAYSSPTEGEDVPLPQQLDGREQAAWGRRHKKIVFINIHVYDVAYYLDKSSKLWGKKSFSVDDIANDAPDHATLLIEVTNSHVTNARMADALRESITPRMPAGAKQGDLDAFVTKLTSGPAVTTGSKIKIQFHPGSLDLKVKGQSQGSIPSSWLNKAILECYFDDKAVIPNFEKRLRKRLPDGPGNFKKWDPDGDAWE